MFEVAQAMRPEEPELQARKDKALKGPFTQEQIKSLAQEFARKKRPDYWGSQSLEFSPKQVFERTIGEVLLRGLKKRYGEKETYSSQEMNDAEGILYEHLTLRKTGSIVWKPAPTGAVPSVTSEPIILNHREETVKISENYSAVGRVSYSYQFTDGTQAHASVIGLNDFVVWNKPNEDRNDAASITLSSGQTYKFLGVYDGHGGDRASEFAKKNTRTYVAEFLGGGMDPSQALTAGLERTEREFLEMAEQESPIAELYTRSQNDEDLFLDGTTAVIALVSDSHLYVANVGDSQVMLITPEGQAFITPEHNYHDAGEQARIRQEGGESKISWDFNKPQEDQTGETTYPEIIGEPNNSLREAKFGTVGVSRAIGDRHYKIPAGTKVGDNVAQATGVRVLVDTFEIPLPEGQSAVLIGSDGFFDYLDASKGSHIVTTQHCINKVFSNPNTAAEELINDMVNYRVYNSLTADDVTLMVMPLNKK